MIREKDTAVLINSGGIEMKLTRVEKIMACGNCKHADKRALRKRWPHCQKEYKAFNGHCANFEKD